MLSQYLSGITALLWGLFRIPPPKERPLNVSVWKRLNLETVKHRYGGFRFAKSAFGVLLLTLFGLSPAVQAAADLTATTMVAVLQNDADSDTLFSPGDTIRYIVTIDNTGDAADTSVVFTLTPDTDTTLPGSTVTTTQGTVTSGNTVGDTTVSVSSMGSVAVGTPVTIKIDVTINSPLSSCTTSVTTQGTVTSTEHSGGILTDDINNAAVDDATVTSLTVPNNAPTASDNTVSTPENAQKVFAAADFNFSDIDCSDSLSKIQITQLETVGDLYLDANDNEVLNAGEDVTLSQEIDAVDILRLKFIPVTDDDASPYTTFKFKVKDATDYSASEYTMTINVVPNQAPTGTDKTVTTLEDTAYTFVEADFGYSDADTDPFTSIEITQLETVGALQLSGADVTLTQVILVADIPNLTFTPATNGNGTGYDTFQFTVNDGNVDSSSAYTMTMDVTAVNDAPTAADNTVTTNEDTTYTFAEADFGFSDVDADTLVSVEITTLETVGALQLSGADVTLNQVITVADITASNLTFAPVADANGTGYDNFQFTVNDGTVDSASANTMTIDVTAVNDAPTAADNTVTTNEDTAYSFAEADFGFSDVDADTLVSVEITTLETVGALQLSGADVTVNQVIAVADITASNLTFTPAANASGTGYDTFQFTVNDGTADSASPNTMTIDVTAVNDAPTAADNTVTTNEDTALAFAEADFGFSDAESDPFTSVEITTLETVGALQLSGADVTLNQVITVANIAASNLTFTPAADGFGTGYDTFQFTVNDGTVDSSSAYTMTINVTAQQDAPTAADNTVTTNEDTTYTFAEADFGFSDVDGDTLVSVEITTLEIVGALQLSGADVTLNQVIAVADITASNLTFAPVANDSGTGYDNFQFTVNDGTVDSASANTMTIDVTPVNDLPTAADNTVTTNEDTAYPFVEADFGFSDGDGDTLVSVEITTLETVGTLQLSGADVTLNQVIAVADITASNLTFTPAANASGAAHDTFQFTVNDGTADSASAYTMTIDVTAQPDAPTAADNTVTTDEDTTYTFAEADFGFSDVDGDTLVSVEITTLEIVGALQLSGADVTLNQVIAVADITASNLTFAPVAGANGTGYDSFQFTVNDGTADSASPNTMTIDVTAVNDAPTAADNTVTTNEDAALAFAEADFGFSDVDSGDTLSSVEITALETVGALQLSGADVTLNQVIAVADITASNLTFTPAANASGAAHDTFQFTVNDGTADSASAYTMTIDVTAVNDAPTATDNTVTTNEDTAYPFVEADFGFSDVDGDTLVSVEITTLETVGALQLSGADVTANQVIPVANIPNLTFTPAANANGAAHDTFQFTVNDGTADSASANTMTIDVTAVNDAPTAADNTVSTNEDNDKVFAAADFGFSDVDTGDTLSKIQITTLPGAGTLYVDIDTNYVIDSPGDDIALLQDILVGDIPKLHFKPVADANGTPYTTFTFKVHDGTAFSTLAYTMTIDVTAVNDAPSFALLDNTPTFVEDSSAVVLDPNATISDPELNAANDYNGATLTLIRTGGTYGTANPDDVFSGTGTLTSLSGTLTVDSTNIGTVTNSGGTLLLTFDANATRALVNSALQQIAYSNTSDAPDASVQIDYFINDKNTGAQGNGGELTWVESITVTITQVNDAPVITVPGTQTTNEDTPLTFSTTAPNVISISDVDAGALGVEVYLIANKGTLTLFGTSPFTGLTFTGGDGTDDVSMVFTGTTTDINTALNGMIFTPEENFNGTGTVCGTVACVLIVVNDQGNTGGGTIFVNDEVVININAINDDPVFTSTAVTAVDENSLYSYSIVATDVDTSDTLTITVPTTASWLTLTTGGGGTETLSGTPTNDDVGTHNVTLRVNDGTEDIDQSFTITVTNVNDAPVLDNTKDKDGNTADLSLDAIAEDAGTPSGVVGTLISDLVALSGNVTDVDGVVTGVALTAALTTNGSWYYTLNATTWIAMSSVADNNALLLAADANTRLYFQPNANFNGTITNAITLRAWDQSSGTAGNQVDASTNGGTTAFSSATDTANLTVTAINDAPVFTSTAVETVDEDNAYSYSVVASDVDGDALTITAQTTLPSWLSLTTTGGGTETLSGTPTNSDVGTHIVTLRVSDTLLFNDQTFTVTVANVNDAPVFTSAAVTAVNENSAYSYSIVATDVDVGDTLAITVPTTASWLTLVDNTDGTGTLSGTPTNSEVGTHNVTLRVNDGTVDVDQSFTVTVANVNDAPVLDNTKDKDGNVADLSLDAIDEDAGAPSGVVGTLISDLVALGGNVTDVDNVAVTGVALTAALTTDGSWHYTLDGGTTWIAVGSVADDNALLLAADANTRLYFEPNADFNGTITDAITLRAWDQTSGTAGNQVDTSVNGGTTTFSSATDTANLTVTAVNDAPVFTSTAVTAVDEDSAYNYSVAASDVDGDALTITVPTTASWLTLVDNTDGTGTLSGTPTDSDVGTHNVTLRVNDGTIDVDQSFTITVTNVNDAPVLDNTLDSQGNTADLSLDAIAEDAGAPSGAVGTLISDLVALSGNVTDADSSAVTGVALTAILTTNGSWHYTLDGGTTWTIVGGVADNNPLLLAADANTRIYFQPNANFNGTITDAITLRAWDQSSGTAGNFVSTNSNGGTTAFSSATDTANLTVTAVNDAPVFTSTAVTAVNEDSAYSYSIVASDVDGDSLTIIASTTLSSWLTLTANGGGTETLSGIPTNSDVGTHNVTLRVNDGTVDVDQSFTVTVANVNDAPVFTSTAGTAVDEDSAYSYSVVASDVDAGDTLTLTLTAPTLPSWLSLVDNGGGTGTLSGTPTNSDVGAHSVTLRVTDTGTLFEEQTFTVTVTNVNDAPVLDSTKDKDGNTAVLSLTAIDEDAGAPSGVVGTLISDLVALSSGNVTDVDSGAVTGVALTAALTTNGSWYYTLDGGTTWIAAGSVADASALLLAADVDTRLYFEPNTNFNGSITDAITLRAWDQTSGTAGTQVDTSVNGDTTAFSSATDTASLTVNALNDAPVFDSTEVTSVDEDSAYSYSIVATDVDTGDTLTITAPTTVSWLTLVDNTDGTGTLSGTPTNAEVGAHSVTLRVTDVDGLFDDQSFTITVANVNDAPVLDNTKDKDGNVADLSLDAIAEDAGAPSGAVGTLISDLVALSGNVTDADSSAVTGVALTAILTTNGSWHYTLDGGTTWTIVGGVADNNPLLLAADANTRLYFQPNTNFNGSITDAITLRAWDQSSGTAGNFVSTNSNGGTTAFSSATDTANLTVTAVNDAPVFTSTAVIAVDEDIPYSYSVVATDVDTGDTLTITAQTKPSWLTLTAGGGGTETLSGIPTNDDVGAHSVTLRVSDGSLSEDQTFTVTVANVNDVPVFTSTAVTAVDEDSAYSYSVVATDVDVGDTLAITVPTTASWLTLVDNTDGTGTLSGTPTNSEVGAHNITLRVNDGTVDIDQSFTITVANVNDAPVLDNTKDKDGNVADLSLDAIDEDAGAPSGAVGTLISDLVALSSGNVTDVDSGAVTGVALTAALTTNGSWYYTLDGGTTWIAAGSVADASALLLAADVDTRLYFEPNTNFNGSITDAITLRAWDQTSGTAGTQVDTSVNGDTTAFSSATDTASLTVNALNDAPVFDSTEVTSVDEDSPYSYSIVASDIDTGDTLTITAQTTLPSWLSLTTTGGGTETLSGTPTNSEVGIIL